MNEHGVALAHAQRDLWKQVADVDLKLSQLFTSVTMGVQNPGKYASIQNCTYSRNRFL